MACVIAAPITSADEPLPAQVRAALDAGASLIELRADCIDDADAIEQLLLKHRDGRFILTFRAAAEGGRWEGDDSERIALYERLGLLLPGYIDVELSTWQRSANLRQKIRLVCEVEGTGNGEVGTGPTTRGESNSQRRKNRLILSHHNWRETPASLDAIFTALQATPAAVIKAVFHAHDARDALRVLAALREYAPRRPTIALAMGEAGLLTRVLAGKFGAFLTFAALHAAAASAPGQPTIRELRERYRWDSIGPQTRVYGVIGWPVSHSRSPEVHNAAMAADSIDGVYLPLPVAPDEAALFAFLDAVAASPWLDAAGFSVTLPHKEHAAQWLAARGHEISPLARRCGCVNTLSVRYSPGGRRLWRGDNSDATAAARVLEAAMGRGGRATAKLESLDGRRIDVLGAGGAARAVAVGLLDRGCRVTIFNRNAARAAALAAELGCDWKAWDQRVRRDGEILVNCTPVGMSPRIDESPLPADAIAPAKLVFDTIYNPAMTCLLHDAAAAGSVIISGLDMFHAQAAEQYQIWHERPAPFAPQQSPTTRSR